MREPQVEVDEPDRMMALSWFVRDVQGVAVAEHDGGTNGQMARLMLAPEAGFALAILTNHSPAGGDLIRELTREAWRVYFESELRDPEPIELDAKALADYAGVYANPWSDAELHVEGGGLVAHVSFKAGFPTKDTPPIPPLPPIPLAFYGEDRVFATEGTFKGVTGDFVRDKEGGIAWFRWGGRLHAARS